MKSEPNDESLEDTIYIASIVASFLIAVVASLGVLCFVLAIKFLNDFQPGWAFASISGSLFFAWGIRQLYVFGEQLFTASVRLRHLSQDLEWEKRKR